MARKNPSLIKNPETTVDKIEYQYLINKDLDNRRVKLRTVTMDNEILQHIFNVNGEESELDLKNRQSNVYKVYAKFREYFSKRQGGLDKYIDGLEKFEIESKGTVLFSRFICKMIPQPNTSLIPIYEYLILCHLTSDRPLNDINSYGIIIFMVKLSSGFG